MQFTAHFTTTVINVYIIYRTGVSRFILLEMFDVHIIHHVQSVTVQRRQTFQMLLAEIDKTGMRRKQFEVV